MTISDCARWVSVLEDSAGLEALVTQIYTPETYLPDHSRTRNPDPIFASPTVRSFPSLPFPTSLPRTHPHPQVQESRIAAYPPIFPKNQTAAHHYHYPLSTFHHQLHPSTQTKPSPLRSTWYLCVFHSFHSFIPSFVDSFGQRIGCEYLVYIMSDICLWRGGRFISLIHL